MLTAKQEHFCQASARGKNQSDAYRESYDCQNMAPETINNEAYILMQNQDITMRINELRERITASTVMDVKEKQSILAEIARDKEAAARDRINAVDTDNKMKHIYTTITDSNITIRVTYDGSRQVIDSPEVKELTEGESV